jgi:hypothetical protein
VYLFPRAGSSLVRFGVLDRDDHDGKHGWPEVVRAARAAYEWLIPRGCTPSLFRSSGGLGIHIVVFSEEPQYAASMIALLNEAKAQATTEVLIETFPKKDRLEEDVPGEKLRYGNFAALPFAGKSCLLDENFEPVDAAQFDPQFSPDAPIRTMRNEALHKYGSALIGPGRLPLDEAKDRVRKLAATTCSAAELARSCLRGRGPEYGPERVCC